MATAPTHRTLPLRGLNAARRVSLCALRPVYQQARRELSHRPSLQGHASATAWLLGFLRRLLLSENELRAGRFCDCAVLQPLPKQLVSGLCAACMVNRTSVGNVRTLVGAFQLVHIDEPGAQAPTQGVGWP